MRYHIEYWPIERLEEYGNNPRIHEVDAVQQLADAINEFGFRVPILAKSDGSLIDGHMRLKAARVLGLTEVPVMPADDMTDEQIRAFRLAVNRMAELADWDLDRLAEEVQRLDLDGFDLELLGFDESFLGELLDGSLGDDAQEGSGHEEQQETPEPQPDPVSVLGDVWVLGSHRVMCGDSTSIDAVETLMAGEKAQMVYTDPPYGVEYQSNYRTKSAKFEMLKNDDVFLDIAPVIDTCSDGWVFVWTSWKVLTKWIDQFVSFGYPTNQVIWHKPGGGIGDLKRTFSSDYETALVWHRGAELTGKRVGSVWKVGRDGANAYLHPTQKPVALAEEAIDKTTKPGWTVLDLFGGSGSTLIACENTGRQCRMMELDPRYVDVIIKRWQNHTGKQAVLESTGQTFEEVTAARGR